jgi:delta24-sterol reductase
VRAVAAQVRARPQGTFLTIRKDTPSHGVRATAYKRDSQAVDVSPLTHILSIDPGARTATVEDQVPLGRLCREALAQGLLPQVVPEYPTFTVAGLVNGEGLQSSSHRYGVFSRTITALEVVLGDGSVVVATPDQHPHLFGALPGSLGTLGVVTAGPARAVSGPIFILGAHRSGTTWLHQLPAETGQMDFLMAHHVFSYRRFPQAPPSRGAGRSLRAAWR